MESTVSADDYSRRRVVGTRGIQFCSGIPGLLGGGPVSSPRPNENAEAVASELPALSAVPHYFTSQPCPGVSPAAMIRRGPRWFAAVRRRCHAVGHSLFGWLGCPGIPSLKGISLAQPEPACSGPPFSNFGPSPGSVARAVAAARVEGDPGSQCGIQGTPGPLVPTRRYRYVETGIDHRCAAVRAEVFTIRVQTLLERQPAGQAHEVALVGGRVPTHAHSVERTSFSRPSIC